MFDLGYRLDKKMPCLIRKKITFRNLLHSCRAKAKARCYFLFSEIFLTFYVKKEV
jgi:hypothetical protein